MKITPLDKGLEDISWEIGEVANELPDVSFLTPSELPPEHKLDSVILSPSVDEKILSSLKPPLKDRSITNPVRFNQLTISTANKLKKLADKMKAGSDRIVAKIAADVLDEQRELMEILNAYRKLLVQG